MAYLIQVQCVDIMIMIMMAIPST